MVIYVCVCLEHMWWVETLAADYECTHDSVVFGLVHMCTIIIIDARVRNTTGLQVFRGCGGRAVFRAHVKHVNMRRVFPANRAVRRTVERERARGGLAQSRPNVRCTGTLPSEFPAKPNRT